MLGEPAAVGEHVGDEQHASGRHGTREMTNRLLPVRVIHDVIQHIESVDDIEGTPWHGIPHVGPHEARLGELRRQPLHGRRGDVDPRHARAPLQVEVREEPGAAPDVEHARARQRDVRFAQRSLQHLAAQRIAGAVVGQGQAGLAGAAQIEVLAQPLLPELPRLVAHGRPRYSRRRVM